MCLHLDPRPKSATTTLLEAADAHGASGYDRIQGERGTQCGSFSFVAERDGSGKVRKVLETRRVTERFLSPNTTDSRRVPVVEDGSVQRL